MASSSPSRIVPSIPRRCLNPGYLEYLTEKFCNVPTGEAEGDLQPKKKYKSGLIMPPAAVFTSCTCSSLEKKTPADMDELYVSLAKKALTYYNAKENTDLSFVKVNNARRQCSRKNKIHMNFIASLEDGVEKLFFAEFVDGKLKTEHIDEIRVSGCCLLQKIEPGNPVGHGCGICGKKVIHPGPRDGCIIVGGDLFEGYPFWGYRSGPRNSNATRDDKEMYLACAMKALKCRDGNGSGTRPGSAKSNTIGLDLESIISDPLDTDRIQIHI